MKYLKKFNEYANFLETYINNVVDNEVSKSLKFGLKIRENDIIKEKNIIYDIVNSKLSDIKSSNSNNYNKILSEIKKMVFDNFGEELRYYFNNSKESEVKNRYNCHIDCILSRIMMDISNNIINESKNENLKSMLDQSSDWIKLDSVPYRSSFDLIYKYRYTKSDKWEYLICTLKGYDNYILYLVNKEDESISFLSYLDSPVNGYHERYFKFNTPLKAAVKYFELQQNVLDFFDSIPDEEIIEEWFTYLTDSFKKSSIDTGFIDWKNESSFYNLIDFNSGNPVICVSFDDDNINKEGLDITDYDKKQDYKENKIFVNNNPDFITELSSVINRAEYYLGDNYKYYHDYKIYILSWGVIQVVIELNKRFEY